MNAIEIKKLTKKYKDVIAVDGLELSVRRGELFALLGVNGAGKTTTIKMLSCLTSPTSGEAFLDGKSIASQPGEVKRIIGVSPQETAVAPNLTVMENLELMCGVHGLSKDKTRVRAQALCEEFKLGEAKERKAGKLSGGWQRRLSIAMALTGDPEILFLDEPTTGLHMADVHKLVEVLQRLTDAGNTVIVIEHNLDVIQCADHIIDLGPEGGDGGGELVFAGTPEECAACPASFTGEFLKPALERYRK